MDITENGMPASLKYIIYRKILHKNKKLLTNRHSGAILLISKTVEAEIKPFKTAQRARGAESRVRNCLANGPLRAQSKDFLSEYSATSGTR